MNAAMAAYGATLVQHGDNILTHCNTGSLATPGVGTALGVIREAHRQNKKIHVYVDETRPLLQGGRLTAYELKVMTSARNGGTRTHSHTCMAARGHPVHAHLRQHGCVAHARWQDPARFCGRRPNCAQR